MFRHSGINVESMFQRFNVPIWDKPLAVTCEKVRLDMKSDETQGRVIHSLSISHYSPIQNTINIFLVIVAYQRLA